MKIIKYSVLTSKKSDISNTDLISSYLTDGIKVIAFGSQESIDILNNSFSKYVNARLLQTYVVGADCPQIEICDGEVIDSVGRDLELLSKSAKNFNLEQYSVEHCCAEDNLIVEAGAGTGKTTVMIDRIMFLLHTVPNLMPEDIGMITFTNEATQHMKHKIQQEFLNRYTATGLPKYVELLENSASLHIQTIDSFSKEMISEFGTSVGYGSSVSIRGYKYEKLQLIRKTLNEYFKKPSNTVSENLGLTLNELEDVVLQFWERLNQAGLSDNEIALLDWGEPEDNESVALHSTLSSIFPKLCKAYNIIKKENDAISVDDIVRELDRIILSGNSLRLTSNVLKYLFVDEFQDSDNAQIRSIAWLQKEIGLKLFVVGDVKQSIYRFRGAVDTAFEKLKGDLKQFTTFTLVRNYRTSKHILADLDPIFRGWESAGIFDYGTTLEPQKMHKGIFNRKQILKKNSVIRNETVKLLRDCIRDCKKVAKENATENEKFQRVTVLTRTNFQLKTISDWCRAQKIPCYLKTEGTFYSSRAVLDFFSMIKAFIFPASVQHLVDYVISPYSDVAFDIEKLEGLPSESNDQLRLLKDCLGEHQWDYYLKEFRLKPIMSVIDKIVSETNPAMRFAEDRTRELTQNSEWDVNDLQIQLSADVKQYNSNLDKLLTILRSHFSGQMANLFELYSFLKLNILTNHNEDEPDISDTMGCECVYGLTVHKAKGLEFDTVIIPFTQREYRREVDTELLLDETKCPQRIGWSKVEWADNYRTEILTQQRNNYYSDCVNKEFSDVDREEARLLYVAMTRSIRRLECFIIDPKPHNWAGLLR